MMRWLSLFLAATAPGAAFAQVQPLMADSRVETFLFEPGKRYVLRTAVDGTVTVILSPGESINQVTLGDPRSFDAAISPQGDSLVLRTLRPVRGTSLAVQSNLRSYEFDVVVGPPNDVAYAVRFGFTPMSVQPAPMPMGPPDGQLSPVAGGSTYQLKGAAALLPVSVREDGRRTYIEWGPDQALPAVFALNSAGDEETVDGYMRGGLFTIDRVHDRLVFRLGKSAARARRITPKKRAAR